MNRVPLASFNDVHKSFGPKVALDGITFDVAAGDSLGLLGPNGAGKTTLISMLTGLRRPDRGEVRLFGGSPSEPAIRADLGVTPQATAVPANLRVGEIFALVAAHFVRPRDIRELMAEFGLTELVDRQSGGLSGGQQRRLLVALALVGDPALVVLDEPTTGLDVEARETLWNALRGYRDDGGTLVITSHYLAEIEALASRVVVVDHGSVVADGTVPSIRQRVQLRRITLTTTATESELVRLPGVVSVTDDDGRRTIVTRAADAAVRALVERGVPFTELEVHGASLEEAFLAMTRPKTTTSAA